LGESLKDYLESKGLDVNWVKDDRKLDEAILMSEYDVIVLDLMLKYNKGENILKQLRDKGIKLIMTAKNRIEDKEVYFELGADDYLSKPFNLKEVLLRIKALSKRLHAPDTEK
jgi:DNA-binding response OmpR family regulator